MFAFVPVLQYKPEGSFRFDKARLFEEKALNRKVVGFPYLCLAGCSGKEYKRYTFSPQVFFIVNCSPQFVTIHMGHVQIAKYNEWFIFRGFQISEYLFTVPEEFYFILKLDPVSYFLENVVIIGVVIQDYDRVRAHENYYLSQ